MKRAMFGLLVLAAGLSAQAVTQVTTNFIGTVATQQQILACVLPTLDVSWTSEILQDTEGDESVYYVGPHCPEVIANWLANSTTNTIGTYTNAPFRVNGHTGQIRLTPDGLITLGDIETYQDVGDSGYNRARISIEEKTVSDTLIRIKWRYYRWDNTNGQYKYRECTLTMTVTPRWRFQLATSATP